MAGMKLNVRGLFIFTSLAAFVVWLVISPDLASVAVIPLLALWPFLGVAIAILAFERR